MANLLVLPGGGPHGIMVHLGILKVLESYGYRFDQIHGISAGAIAGYCYRKVGAALSEKKLRATGTIIQQRPLWKLRLFHIDHIVRQAPLSNFLNRFTASCGYPEGLRVTAYNETLGKLEHFDEPKSHWPVVAAAAARPVFPGVKMGEHTYSDAGPISNIPDYDPRRWKRIVVVVPKPQGEYRKKKGLVGNLIHNWEIRSRDEYDREVTKRLIFPNIYFLTPHINTDQSWFRLNWNTLNVAYRWMLAEQPELSKWWKSLDR